jgi:ribosomal protein S18 acetylase RimI-like enzyme
MIRPGTAEDKKDVCHHLAIAFQHRTFLGYLTKRAKDQKRALEDYFHVMWDLCPLVFVNDKKDAGAMWFPPEHKIPFKDDMRAAWAMFRHDPLRLPVGLKAKYVQQRMHPDSPHYYLFALGVSPTSQRTGAGKALIAEGLKLCDEHAVGAYLETGNPDNIKYYKQFGFQQQNRIDIGWGAPSFWTMFRPAKG